LIFKGKKKTFKNFKKTFGIEILNALSLQPLSKDSLQWEEGNRERGIKRKNRENDL
jgi:hypothetical protein